MEAGGCEQLVSGPVKPKGRVQLRLWQDSWKKARRGSLVLGSDFISITSQFFFNIFAVEEQRAEQAEGQTPSVSEGTGRDIHPTA